MPFLQIDNTTTYSNLSAWFGGKQVKYTFLTLSLICLIYTVYIHNNNFFGIFYPEIQNLFIVIFALLGFLSSILGLKDNQNNRWVLEIYITNTVSYIQRKYFTKSLYKETHKLFAQELNTPDLIKFNKSYRLGFEYIDNTPYNPDNFAHVFKTALLGLNPSFNLQFITSKEKDSLLDLKPLGLEFTQNYQIDIYKSYLIVHFSNPKGLFNILTEVQGHLNLSQWRRLNNQEIINLIK